MNKDKHYIFEQVQVLAIKTNKKMQETFIWNYKSAFTWEWLDYKESNHYNEWDNIKNIDWKSTAKTWNLFVKKYEETRKLKIKLIIDNSNSLNTWIKELKKDKLIETVALIAFSAMKNWDYVSLDFLLWNKKWIKFGSWKNHTYKILEKLLEEDFSEILENYEEKITEIDKIKKWKSIVFIFSDFENKKLINSIKKLNHKNEVIAIFIIDNLNLIEEKNWISEIKNPITWEVIEIDWCKFEEFKKEFEIKLKEKKKELLKYWIESVEIMDNKSLMDSFMELFKRKQ